MEERRRCATRRSRSEPLRGSGSGPGGRVSARPASAAAARPGLPALEHLPSREEAGRKRWCVRTGLLGALPVCPPLAPGGRRQPRLHAGSQAGTWCFRGPASAAPAPPGLGLQLRGGNPSVPTQTSFIRQGIQATSESADNVAPPHLSPQLQCGRCPWCCRLSAPSALSHLVLSAVLSLFPEISS